MKKWFSLLLVLVLLACGSGCSKKNKEIIPEIEADAFWIDENELESLNDTIEQSLFQEYEDGLVEEDKVVSQALSSIFDNGEESDNIDIDSLIRFADEHWDELTVETKVDYYEKIFLGGIDFEYQQPNSLSESNKTYLYEELKAEKSVSDAQDQNSTSSVISKTLNHVILSEDGHFLIWYTTEGSNAVSNDYAKQVAQTLENAVDAYDELFGTNYVYNVVQKVTGSVLAKQKNMLKKTGLDGNLLESALSVYIYDNDSEDDVLAYYSTTDKDVSVFIDLAASLFDAVPEGIAVLPYIVIKPDSIKNKVNFDQIINHELFHHYQHQVLKNYSDKYSMQAMACEATAHLSSALITENKNTTNAVLNDWASLYGQYTANWKSFQRKRGSSSAGYLIYPVLYNYAEYVSDGLEIICESLYSSDFFVALQNEANVAQRNKMMRMLLLHTLNNNYENNNLKNNYKYKIPYTYIKANSEGKYEVTKNQLDPMGIRYYRIIKAKGTNMDFVFDSIGENTDAVLLSKVNGRYQIIQSLTRFIGKLSTVGFEDINEFFVVCFNTSFTQDGSYCFTPEKTKATVTEIPTETAVDGYTDFTVPNTVEESTKQEETTSVTENNNKNYSVGLEFKSNGDGTCSVSGIGTCKDTEIVIPVKSPQGDTVTSIGDNAFEKCYDISSIIIPDCVTSIGNRAFYYCSDLTYVTIGSSVTSIGDSAFFTCCDLQSITIPDSVTYIGEDAFRECTDLTSIIIPDNVTSVGNSAFNKCKALSSVTIGKGLTCISSYMFADCYHLTSITVPDNIISIELFAFKSCWDLTSVTIENGVKSIGYGAFENCYDMTSITIPNSVIEIGTAAFNSNLSSVTFNGTKAQWSNRFNFNVFYTFYNEREVIINCQDGTISY